MFGIEGVIKQRSSHASGVILNDENPYEFLAYMKTPNGEVITQFDLHTSEALGATKYDFLVTEIQDKEAQCIKMLQANSVIEPYLSLREVYDKYFHPDVIDIENPKIWKAIQNNNILSLFQFDSQVGSQAIKKIQPTNMLELSDANGLMRLMTGEKGEEIPMDRYVRLKNDLSAWYQEMDDFGLTKEEVATIEPYFKPSYGTPPSQEQMMMILMDKDICGFTLAEANAARKIVGRLYCVYNLPT
jgi:DNA polymerase-3 subunit alpha